MVTAFSFDEARHKLGHIRHLALGFFDGLHLGHRAVIFGTAPPSPCGECGILTFSSHPATLLRPESAPLLLTGMPHKTHLLRQWSIGGALFLKFDKEQSLQSAEAFLESLGMAFPGLHLLSAGDDWRFGHQRKGDLAMLREWASERSIDVRVESPVQHGGKTISSSRIRKAIAEGQITEASAMLGRSYALYGQVVRGDQRGRTLGFPTANLSTEDECLPPNGVYAGTALTPNGDTHRAAINIGLRPSIEGTSPHISIEAHLLDFEGDLYDQALTVTPVVHLRGEEKFPGLDALKNAIQRDVEATRRCNFPTA